MKHLVIIGIIFLSCLSLKAQNKYFPIKGSIVSADSLSPIPDAHILSEISYYGTTSDTNGKFAMLVKQIDTLRISSVGFVTKLIPIYYDSVDVNNFNIIMEKDTVMLQEIDIFPYLDNHTVEEIISKIPIVLPKQVLYEDDIDVNIQNYYYHKTKDFPKVKGYPFILYNPIKKVFDRFNKKERLKRKLERNRKKYLESE
jgi:hypothetical protein